MKFSELLSDKYDVKKLWHVAHMDNLKSILRHGLLCRNEVEERGIHFKDISDPSVQRRRDRKVIGPEWVPLFFADNTPMLYVSAKKDPCVIVLEIDVGVSDIEGVVFSDGNIAAKETEIYHLSDKLSLLDWDILQSDRPTLSKEWKRKRSAEMLIPEPVAIRYVQAVHVQSPAQECDAQTLMNAAQVEVPIQVDLTPSGVGRVINLNL